MDDTESNTTVKGEYVTKAEDNRHLMIMQKV
jgi:hypothetical protein